MLIHITIQAALCKQIRPAAMQVRSEIPVLCSSRHKKLPAKKLIFGDRTIWLAASVGPADRLEGVLSFRVPHAQDQRERERAGLCGQEEMLRHLAYSLFNMRICYISDIAFSTKNGIYAKLIA